MVVVGVAGSYLAVPVEAETDLVKLFAVAVDILLCCDCRVLSCLYGILLCRESVCIVTHRVEYVETL